MRKFINIVLAAFMATSVVGCSPEFGIPEPAHVYSDADFSEHNIVSIKEFKEMYKSHVGKNSNEIITEDLVIRGKVISSDESGNVYKSLFIQDGEIEDGTRAGIELRLFAGNYTKYPIGSTVYVKLKDLSIGDYKGMISVGAHSFAAEEAGNADYVHSTIESRPMLAKHIFLGAKGKIESSDIKVITKANCSDVYTDASNNYLACLVRFEGLTSTFGSSSWGYANSYPNYFLNASTNFEWSESFVEIDPKWATPTMAYMGANPLDPTVSPTERYYGSAWYSYNPTGTNERNGEQYVIRLSGYARFKDRPVPANGTTVNITAIMTQFGNTYQLIPRFSEDIEEIATGGDIF